jgi:hypothetical protein
MIVLYAVVCEHAATREDGRLDIHGVFHQLYAPGFPAQQGRLVLAVGLEWGTAERGRKEFRIDLLDPAESPVISISGHTDVADREGALGPPQTRLLMPIDDVIFPAEGSYRFVLNLDGESLPLAPLHLITDPTAGKGSS